MYLIHFRHDFQHAYCILFFFLAGFGTPSDLLPPGTIASSVLSKASPLNTSQCMKFSFSIKTTGLDKMTRNAEKITQQSITAGIMAGRSQKSTDTSRSDNRAKILKMISVLAELHKTFNSTLSSQITLIPHGNFTLFSHLCGF